MMDYFAGLARTGNVVDDVTRFLEAAGRPDTLAHCRAVAVQAQELAVRYEADVGQSRLAGICHDLAAVVPRGEAVVVARAFGLTPDPVERTAPVLLHGPIAAAVLYRKLGVMDSDVLNAVKYHTTSRVGAASLELLLFVADKIALDPAAPIQDLVPAVRAAAQESLERAAFVYLDWVITHAGRLGWTPHPNALAARDELRG